jgi:hypothetical protein
VSDDWRVTVTCADDGDAGELAKRLQEPELEHDLDHAFDQHVIISHSGADVFLYAGSREQAEAAARAVSSVASEKGWKADTAVTRWHPDSEAWEDPDEELPDTAEERKAEHDELIARERAAAEAGHPEWEVRVDLPSHGEAVEFAKKLEAEGMQPVRRWKFLVVGATDEDQANLLADKLRAEAPAGSQVTAEGTWRSVSQGRPNPFRFLGGLGS